MKSRDQDDPKALFEKTLARLDDVLSRENAALRRLDGEAIEEAVDRKLELSDELGRLRSGIVLEAEQRDALERIHRAALANQLLLVHARACVRSALDLATGQLSAGYTRDAGAPATPGPMRVSLRG